MIIPQWDVPDSIRAVSSIRSGGVSTGIYHSLNLGMHVGDLVSSVEENRLIIQREAAMPSAPIWLNQTHSTTVLKVDCPTSLTMDADGVFTQTPGVVCSVMTADCLPVLLTNTSGTQVAAVHAGWRGLANGILEECANFFSGEIIAWLGPAIGKEAFEVGQDVVDAFVAFDASAELAFAQREFVQDKWWANLEKLATQRLNRLGITAVFPSGQCTFTQSQRFFSFRRDGVTGRQASFIWID